MIAQAFTFPCDVVQRMETIAFLLGRVRFPLGTERGLQDAIAETFRRNHLVADREKRLGPDDIPDFFVPLTETGTGIAVEAKITGGRREIHAQCERYCAHPEVAGLVLATAKAGALPAVVAGKPTLVVNLGRAWL